MNLIGAVLDERYQIQSLLGEGGMGAVYRAVQPEGPPVAIKVLHEELGGAAELRERFEREARALFGLEHPHILHVIDFGITEGRPYLVMELLAGKSLDALIEEESLHPEQAFDLATQVLEGLAFAHQSGVLHRDLKTENVFVTHDANGRPIAKLLDFGLAKFTDDERWGSSAKLTVQGSIFGTPAYMPPEQCAGAPVDARGDVYAIGVILFELFTGEWPFMEDTRMKMFQAHFRKPVPRMSDTVEGATFREELEAIVQKAMAKAADDRFQHAGEMLTALRQVPRPVARGEGIVSLTPNAPGEGGVPRNVLIGIAATLALLIVAAVIALVVMFAI